MKINSIRLGCRSDSALTLGNDTALIFFRTPVIFTEGASGRRITGSSAVLTAGGVSSGIFRPTDGNTLRYDLVSFRTSAADRQYIAAMDIPLGTPIELKDDLVISGAIRSISSQSARRGKHFSEFAELSMKIIFISLSDAANAAEPSPEETIPRYNELKRLREAIYDDPVSSWSVEDICGEMNISRTYFHRLYFAAFGVTCRQDVIESRLLYATELLKNTDMSVAAIAEQCGYDSESYFMRQFKKHKNCTPSEYRRRASGQE